MLVIQLITRISGAFKSMVHDHELLELPGATAMRDRFEFASPLRILGRMVDTLFLRTYLCRFLTRRNAVIKRLAESPERTRPTKQS